MTAPVVGATVTLWSTGMTAAQVGSSTTTDANGQFTLSFNCPAAGTLMYVTASGGQVGSAAANSKIQMASALGACGSMPASVVVNEVTSAAALYALSGFAGSAGTSPVSFAGKSPGLDQAFVTLTNLVIPGSGTLAAPARVTNTAVVQQRLNTVASAMAACNASTTAGPCAELTSCARAAAAYVSTGAACTGGTTTLTADSLNAGLAIVQNAGLVSSAGIYDVATAPSAAFSPVLASAPEDWTLPLQFSINNYGPLAIDAAGHVWMLAPDPNGPTPPAIPNLAVTEIDADASFLSPHQTGHDWSGGGISSIQGNDITNFAIDQSGNVWASGSGTVVAELTSAGAGAPGAPYTTGTAIGDTSAVTIDSAGDAWLVSGNAAAVFEFSPAGLNKSTSSGYSASNCPCDGMAADGSGNVWVVSSGANQFLAQIGPNGTQGPIKGPPLVAPANDGVYTFTAVANDGSGKLWITDQHNHGVWSFTPSTGGSGSYSSRPFSNAAASGTKPKGIAIDGAGHKWVANNPLMGSLASVTELSVDGATNLSPSDGFGFNVIPGGAYAIAVDGSGNVWVTTGGSTVVEFVGAGAPTKNPIASAISAGSFAP